MHFFKVENLKLVCSSLFNAMCKVGINPDTIAQCATDNAETLLQADADEQAWAKVALRTFYLFERRERMENVF